jgi:cardiolipin synthase
LIIDGLVSSIGTANVDMRSLRLNFESNAFIFDEKIAKTLETDYINDIKNCTQIDVKYYNKRSINVKIKEAISRLLSPLL